MEPDFSNIYKVAIKKYKPSGIASTNQNLVYINETEVIQVLGQDIQAALETAQEYVALLCANSDWSYGEIIVLDYQSYVFLGTKKTGILRDGYKGMPCQTHAD